MSQALQQAPPERGRLRMGPAIGGTAPGSGALVAVGGTVLAYALLVLRGTGDVTAAAPVSRPVMADAVPAR
jgi:hypothetical protein